MSVFSGDVKTSTTTDLYINFDNRKIDEANRKVINALNADLALSRTD